MPVRLLAFDLDGTVVQTERLKARSYALAAADLCGATVTDRVENAYRDLVGRSRQEVAQGLVDRFGLSSKASEIVRPDEEPWEAFIRIRLDHYRAMIEDDEVVRGAAFPETASLVRHARSFACSVALVTTSDRPTTTRVLDALGLASAFDVTVTASDVDRTKPDPEGYLRALEAVGVEAEDGLTIEDSAVGVRAGLAAGLQVLAVPTDLTREGLASVLDHDTSGRVLEVEPGGLVRAVRDALARER